MELKTVIEQILIVLMVVAVGIVVIAMVQGFVADGGVVSDFFKNTIEAVSTKGQSLVSGLSL